MPCCSPTVVKLRRDAEILYAQISPQQLGAVYRLRDFWTLSALLIHWAAFSDTRLMMRTETWRERLASFAADAFAQISVVVAGRRPRAPVGVLRFGRILRWPPVIMCFTILLDSLLIGKRVIAERSADSTGWASELTIDSGPLVLPAIGGGADCEYGKPGLQKR